MVPRMPPHAFAWTRRAFLERTVGGVLASGCLALSAEAAPAPELPKGGVAVLDNCDPVYRGKDSYEDHLSLFDGSGKVRTRTTGLNLCEEIGSPHRIAVDVPANRVWVAETVGRRLLQYDLAGKELLSVPNIKASAIAIDPSTHHLWVARSTGRIGEGYTEVYSQGGKHVATYEAQGFDLAYDPKGKAFWLAETDLVKLSPTGEVLCRGNITRWCSSSLAPDPRTGGVWVLTREHSPGFGKNALLGFDADGLQLHEIELGQGYPFRVAVDPTDGAVWVTKLREALLLFTAAGKLEAEHKLPALAADVEPGTGNAWVVTSEEVLKVNRNGETLTRANLKGKTTQAWVASF